MSSPLRGGPTRPKAERGGGRGRRARVTGWDTRPSALSYPQRYVARRPPPLPLPARGRGMRLGLERLMSNGLHRSDLPERVRTILAKGAVIPAHPLALDPQRAVRPRLAAGAHPLLHRCRRRRACGRRAFDAVRDPRGRALPAGAGAGGRDRQRLDRSAAGHDRRRDRQDRPGRRGSAHGAIARLSRRAAVACAP